MNNKPVTILKLLGFPLVLVLGVVFLPLVFPLLTWHLYAKGEEHRYIAAPAVAVGSLLFLGFFVTPDSPVNPDSGITFPLVAASFVSPLALLVTLFLWDNVWTPVYDRLAEALDGDRVH